TDERQSGGEGEGVAPQRISLRVAAEQPHDGDDRDDEVGGAIEDVPELQEPLRARIEEVLDPRLVERVQKALEPDDAVGVVPRLDNAEVVAPAVSHQRVHAVEGEDVEHLAPPMEPVRARARRCCRGHAKRARRRPGAPTANAGAPSRLTTRLMPYTSRP